MKLMITVFGIFIFGTLFSCICSGVWFGDEDEMSVINALASFNTMEVQGGGGWAVPKLLVTYWSALVTALSWDYPFLSDPWTLFIKIPLWLVSLGVVFYIIEMALNVIQGIVGSVRSLIT